jgi:hypothetical protein
MESFKFNVYHTRQDIYYWRPYKEVSPEPDGVFTFKIPNYDPTAFYVYAINLSDTVNSQWLDKFYSSSDAIDNANYYVKKLLDIDDPKNINCIVIFHDGVVTTYN